MGKQPLLVWKTVGLFVVCSVGVGLAVAEPVDPRFPEIWHAMQAVSHEEWTRWPRGRVRQLEEDRDRLLKKIAVLPQHKPKVMATHLGYHSLFDEPESEATLPSHQLVAKFVFWPKLDSIALAPAFNQLDPEAGVYAFPKRFKIEVMKAGNSVFDKETGMWVQGKETGDWIDVVNWMEEDFPNPGPYPVFFSGINREVTEVRMTVPRESGATYYALGEIYLFFQNDGRTADNMAVWGSSGLEIKVSDSFSMAPLWDTRYLYDNIVGLGVPLSEETVDSEDLLVTYEKDTPCPDQVQLMLDLEQVERIGRIELWPAAAPYQLAVPSFGFPGNIMVELSNVPDFKQAEVIEIENSDKQMQLDNLITVICKGYEAQYIRITLDDLREHKGKRILGLGEISVSEFGIVSSVDCKVSAKGIPDEFLDQLPGLVDGYSRHRRILPESEWIKGLARRRPLDRRLAVVERELAVARETWRVLQLRISVFGGGILGLVLIVGRVFLIRQRRRVLNNLKLRIARDLHDEVGSNLGSISLVAERLENDIQTVEMKEDLSDLSLLAREASASLRDVVWVIDQSTIRLPDLIQKLVERADRVLYGMELSVETPPDCPDRVVPLPFKRHLIMFFKEVIHNCARHSNATQVGISISVNDERLELSVQDNGCGFDPTEKRDGWGVDSMQKRTHELGGEMALKSQPGEGTTVVLTVPLSALLRKTDHLYKTSN